MELRTSTNAMKITTACVRTVVLTTPTCVRARALLLWGSSPVQPRLLVAGNARSLRERSDRQTRRQSARSHPRPKPTLARHVPKDNAGASRAVPPQSKTGGGSCPETLRPSFKLSPRHDGSCQQSLARLPLPLQPTPYFRRPPLGNIWSRESHPRSDTDTPLDAKPSLTTRPERC